MLLLDHISGRVNATFLLATTVLWAASTAQPTGSGPCQDLAQSLSIEGVSVVSSTWYEDGAPIDLPGLVSSCAADDGGSSTNATANICRLVANVTTSPSSEILIEAWLPDEWNNRFLATGNGGIGGCVDYNNLQNGAVFGFATFGSNSGHNGSAGYDFFLDKPESLIDFGYRGIHVEAEVGKQIVEQYYGAAAQHSYYSGCSTGGRQGYTNAILYPDDFDGILIGSPGVDWLHIVATKAILPQRMGWPDLNSPSYIPPQQWPAIVEAQIKLLDPLDGVTDGIIDDPTAHKFDAAVLACGTGVLNDSMCLSPAQVESVNAIYQPIADSQGKIIYPAFDLGASTGVFSSNQVNGTANLTYRIVDDYWKGAVYNTTNFSSVNFTTKDMDFAVELNPGLVNLAGGDYPDGHNVSTFYRRGGKVLALHGHSDQTVTSPLAARTFRRTAETLNLTLAEMHEFYRLFYIPGHGHCAGGTGPWAVGQPTAKGAYVSGEYGDSSHNALSALVSWVEEGSAPEKLVATKFKNDDFVQQELVGQRTVCVYPNISRWDTTGDTNLANSWRCELPLPQTRS
jgi:feruloyl esterase